MGLAILPARLKTELMEVEKYLLNQENEMSEIHKPWAEELKKQNIFQKKQCMKQFREQLEKYLNRY